MSVQAQRAGELADLGIKASFVNTVASTSRQQKDCKIGAPTEPFA